MAKWLLAIPLILLCVPCIGWAGEDDDRLKTRSQGWEDAFNAHDATALAAFYAPDGILLPPNAEFVRGRDSIQAFWPGFFEGVTGKLEIQEVRVLGDLAYVVGTFKIFDVDGKVVDRGKYVEIWKKGNAQWELHRDIWNTSLPK